MKTDILIGSKTYPVDMIGTGELSSRCLFYISQHSFDISQNSFDIFQNSFDISQNSFDISQTLLIFFNVFSVHAFSWKSHFLRQIKSLSCVLSYFARDLHSKKNWMKYCNLTSILQLNANGSQLKNSITDACSTADWQFFGKVIIANVSQCFPWNIEQFPNVLASIQVFSEAKWLSLQCWLHALQCMVTVINETITNSRPDIDPISK